MTRKKARRPASTTRWMTRRIDSCDQCRSTLRWRTSTNSRPYRLLDFGFHVELLGAQTASCGKCPGSSLVVGRADRLGRLLLEQVLAKPGPLSADEIRFLRKALELTGGHFAGLVGVSREHVSHIEQGHAPNLGTAADRLARLMIAAKVDPSLKLMKRLLGALDEHIGTRSRRRTTRHPGYVLHMASRRG